MGGLGNVFPYIAASPTGLLVFDQQSYRGITAISSTGQLASLLGGTASATKDITLAFATTPNQFNAQSGSFLSETLSISGTDTDKIVLQLSYNEAAVLAAGINESSLTLNWIDSFGNSVLAVEGNTDLGEPNTPTPHFGAYDPTTDFVLGYYGVDTYNNTVWAVINHNSDFTVTPVPEPTSSALAISGVAMLLARRRRTTPRV
jgi:hypothetical protein